MSLYRPVWTGPLNSKRLPRTLLCFWTRVLMISRWVCMLTQARNAIMNKEESKKKQWTLPQVQKLEHMVERNSNPGSQPQKWVVPERYNIPPFTRIHKRKDSNWLQSEIINLVKHGGFHKMKEMAFKNWQNHNQSSRTVKHWQYWLMVGERNSQSNKFRCGWGGIFFLSSAGWVISV